MNTTLNAEAGFVPRKKKPVKQSSRQVMKRSRIIWNFPNPLNKGAGGIKLTMTKIAISITACAIFFIPFGMAFVGEPMTISEYSFFGQTFAVMISLGILTDLLWYRLS